MGMYTGFVCKIKVKKEFYELIDCLENTVLEESGYLWKRAYNKFGYEFIKDYMENNSRMDFIPRGGYSYNEDWLEKYLGQDEHYFKDGIWFFGCDLKNYGKEIERFVEVVIPQIAEEKMILKAHYEEAKDEDCNYIEKDFITDKYSVKRR